MQGAQAENTSNEAAPLLASDGNSSNNNDTGYNSIKAGVAEGRDLALHAATSEIGSDIGSEAALSSESSFEEHGTTPWEAFFNLLKGYFGAGMLSLPWALSQLGVYYGVIAVCVMSFWSSYNCWTVVKLKRYIETQQAIQNTVMTNNRLNAETASVHSNPNSSAALETASASSARTNLTFGDVGEWAYGATFQSYVSACVCTQQLAICTVFMSFIGENLLALLDRMNMTGFVDSHAGVITICLPFVMSLSFLPSMKRLAPVMALGTISLGACIALIGVIMGKEWDVRPDDLPKLHLPQMPLAACAILYSYEGICLILPIESSMKEPKHFKTVFWGTMTLVTVVLATFATLNVFVFGFVSNGSITAFLMEAYRNDPSITFYVQAANAAVSLSVLLSYPLQLFPALELIGTSKFASWIGCLSTAEDQEEEGDLSGFEPLPPLPEHDVADMDPLIPLEHHYGAENNETGDDKNEDDDVESLKSQSTMQSVVDAIFPKMIMPGDSPQLRACLVLMTYIIAVVVPNVQALISLVGALAGSSTALLIPPILELAWIKTLEEHYSHKAARNAPKESPATRMASLEERRAEEHGTDGEVPPAVQRRTKTAFYSWCGGKYWASKIKCYILFVFGFVFAGIGTYASLADIIRIYSGEA